MHIFTELLSSPPLQRAIVGGVLLGLLLASLGVVATLRRMAFFGEGIAHASLAGLAIAALAGVAPLPVAIGWSLLIAFVIFLLEKRTTLPRDATIGIVFTASMSLGVVLMHFQGGGDIDVLEPLLFGDIGAVQKMDVVIIAAVTVVILAAVFRARRAILLTSLNEDSARVVGIRANAVTLSLYFALAIAMVLGVHMLGIILVSALLIIPAATAILLARSLWGYMILANITSIIAVISGLVIASIADIPSGASIVLGATVLFGLATLFPRT